MTVYNYYRYSDPLGTILHSRACQCFRLGAHAYGDAGKHALHTQTSGRIKNTYSGFVYLK